MNKIEIQFNKKIKRLPSNSGTVYDFILFNEFYKQHCIVYKTNALVLVSLANLTMTSHPNWRPLNFGHYNRRKASQLILHQPKIMSGVS